MSDGSVGTRYGAGHLVERLSESGKAMLEANRKQLMVENPWWGEIHPGDALRHALEETAAKVESEVSTLMSNGHDLDEEDEDRHIPMSEAMARNMKAVRIWLQSENSWRRVTALHALEYSVWDVNKRYSDESDS